MLVRYAIAGIIQAAAQRCGIPYASVFRRLGVEEGGLYGSESERGSRHVSTRDVLSPTSAVMSSAAYVREMKSALEVGRCHGMRVGRRAAVQRGLLAFAARVIIVRQTQPLTAHIYTVNVAAARYHTAHERHSMGNSAVQWREW